MIVSIRQVAAVSLVLSLPGTEYFLTAMLKLTRIVNRRIDEAAGMTRVEQVRPLLEEFKSVRG